MHLSDRPRDTDANNIGYLALSRRDFDLAAQLLKQVVQSNDKFDDKGLAAYNLGVCLSMQGKLAGALESFIKAEEEASEEYPAGCIFVLDKDAHGLVWREQFEIDDIRPHIIAAIEACRRALGVSTIGAEA